MSGKKTSLITVQDTPITVMRIDREDFQGLLQLFSAAGDKENTISPEVLRSSL